MEDSQRFFKYGVLEFLDILKVINNTWYRGAGGGRIGVSHFEHVFYARPIALHGIAVVQTKGGDVPAPSIVDSTGQSKTRWLEMLEVATSNS